jgi:hypothetical protein
MQSNVKTVQEYLDTLPDDRKKAITALRKAVLKNLPKGFEEVMNYGMIGYVVPHKLYPDGYHCNPEQPLPFMCIASQKNHIAFYHMGLYSGALLDWFKDEWKVAAPKKLDMGKSCIRFKKPDDIPVDLIGTLASKMSAKEWIKIYETNLKR